MRNDEQKLSDYIDRLNKEKKPDEDEQSTETEELKELYQTVRLVRSLKEPAMPGADFKKKLVHSIEKQPSKNRKWTWFTGITCAAVIFGLLFNFMPFQNKTNIVNAMTEAFHKVEAYHGTIKIVQTNAKNESMVQAKVEVWADQDGNYYTKSLEGSTKGTITVNNGQKKWQIQPNQKEVHIFSAFPDSTRFQFELGKEINEVKNAITTEIIGEDTIIGRKATVLEVTPKGGKPYRLWIDKETKLPLQKQTAMQHAIQYKITYTQIAFSDAIPEKLLVYQPPEEYKIVETNPEQVVADRQEAKEVIGFSPIKINKIPDGYSQERFTVIPNKHIARIYYHAANSDKQVIISQRKATGELEPVRSAKLGKVNNYTAEIQSPVKSEAGTLGGGSLYAENTPINSIRWLQDGFEYAVIGNIQVKNLALFAEGIAGGTFKVARSDNNLRPEVDVPYDFEVEKNNQKNVDAGSSPWMLDPVFVAHVFVSLKMSPGGITGEYPISIDRFKVIENNGRKAVVSVSGDKTPIKKVYLKRLIRQDSTGIWTVVGYDPI